MQMATGTIHRAVATILLLAMAVSTALAQAAAANKEQGAVGTGGGAGGSSHGAEAPTSARVPPLPLPLAAVTVQCTKFHVLKDGETCASVARDFRLTLTQFMVLNQDYNYTCGAAPLPHGRWVSVRGTFVG